MSIHFISGKPRGGKGLYSCKLIVDELVNGRRPIVTNLPLRLDPWVKAGQAMVGLRAYLVGKYGRDCDCDKRVLVLAEEEVPDFYRWRLTKDGWQKVPAVNDEKGRVVGFDTTLHAGDGGVLYCIDEAWKYFAARDWATTGKGVLFYAAQHGHFGDDFLIVSQTSKQVDTALRQVAQDFTICRNHGKERFGMFRQPGFFTICVYTEPPTPTLEPMQRSVFRLDAAGLGACYDTSAGAGIAGAMSGEGGAADSSERKKGLSVWWLVPVVVLALVLLTQWPRLVAWLGHRASKIGTGASAAMSGGTFTNAAPAAVPTPQEVANEGKARSAAMVAASRRSVGGGSGIGALPEEEAVMITGIAVLNGKVRVLLSDGETLTDEDRELEFVGRRYCVIRGRVYRWLKHDVGPRHPVPAANEGGAASSVGAPGLNESAAGPVGSVPAGPMGTRGGSASAGLGPPAIIVDAPANLARATALRRLNQ